MTFSPFDPLEFKNTKVTDAALGALKREVENILSSYVGWYDPFAELIQNALDAVEARSAAERASGTAPSYKPKINITIDLVANTLTVTDNGIGLDKDKFEQFLAPNFSFKSGETRGHKGVGATYVAYGFNFMRIATKSPGFSATGRIVNARTWLRSNTTGANPKVEPDDGVGLDSAFTANDRGVSITIRFDDSTHPRQLDWIQASSAENWWKILTVKTALGSITEDDSVEVSIRVNAKTGVTTYTHQGTKYLWLHPFAPKKARLRDICAASDAAYKKSGVSDWKKEMIEHEQLAPLKLSNKHFFVPTERVSVTSAPTREQDVIALFHQLVAGGVIRGIRVMSTNERLTYDGLFRIAFDLEPSLYFYDATENPLGVAAEVAETLKGRITEPRVLEYKFCLDGLIEDLESQDKNLKDIDLCIVWTTGELYKERYGIRSLLLPENADQRQYHGVTHVLADLETDAKHCDLIVLSELVDHLNDPKKSEEVQRAKYE